MRKLIVGLLTVSLFLSLLPMKVDAAVTGDQIVNMALSLQEKIQYGHTFDQSKLIFDCSGFTWYVYKQAGIDLGTVDDDKQALLGKSIPKSELQKGDLVFFWNAASSSKTDVGHVGIYIGEGKYIHNANSTYDVVVSNLYGTYAVDHYITARRILADAGTVNQSPAGSPAPIPTPAPSLPPAADNTTGQASDLAKKIVDYAISLKGKVNWASAYDPANLRFTSSGYTYYVFKHFGVDLQSRNSRLQALQGIEVPKGHLTAGDLVFFAPSSSDNTISHVGIYIGNGKYIQNANATYDVIISDFNSNYAQSRFITARRVVLQ